MARAKDVKSETRVGMTFGDFPPLAHLRRPRDGQDDLLVVLLGGAHGLVDVGELVRGVERISRGGRPRLRDEVPLDEQADDVRVQPGGARDALLAIVDPAEARIVVEPDPHPLARQRGGCEERCKRGQDDDEADGTSHEVSPWAAARNGRGSKAAATLAAAL